MRDLNDVLDLTLRLPIGGKVYEVQPPPAAIGVHLQNRLALGIYADAGLPLDALDDEARGAIMVTDDELPDFARMCLGATYDEMAAEVSAPALEFAVTTAFYAWTVGKAFAEHYWETGGKVTGSAEGQERPMATPTPEAEASTTPSPASPSGTTTRRRKGSRSSSSGAGTGTSSSRTSTPSTASTSTSPNP